MKTSHPYEQQIRLFGFLLSFMARTGVFTPSHCLEASAVDTPRVHAHGNPYRLVRFL